MIDVAALPEGLPSTTTGIWRAIRPASAESLAVVHDPDDVGVEVDVSISVPNADALIVDEQPDVVVALSPEERFLQGTSLFSALRPEALIELSHAMVMLRAPAGSLLFEQGEPGDSCLVIVKGRAVVTRMVRGEDVCVVERCGGDVAGLFALVATRDRQATVVAKTDVEYYEIDQAALEEVLRAHPAARAPLQHFFRERLLVNVVTTLPFFAGQNPDQRKDLIERFVDKVYEDGDELVFEGSEGDGLWVLIDGVVAVGREGERGFEERARIGAGDFLGSLAGSHGAAADLSAVARKATRAAHLSHKHFAPWLQAGLPPATETLHHAGWMVGAHLFAGSGLLPRTRR